MHLQPASITPAADQWRDGAVHRRSAVPVAWRAPILARGAGPSDWRPWTAPPRWRTSAPTRWPAPRQMLQDGQPQRVRQRLSKFEHTRVDIHHITMMYAMHPPHII